MCVNTEQSPIHHFACRYNNSHLALVVVVVVVAALVVVAARVVALVVVAARVVALVVVVVAARVVDVDDRNNLDGISGCF